MENNDWPRATEEVILQAFRTLDTANKGYLDLQELQDLLKTHGEFFRNSEIEDMTKVCHRRTGTCLPGAGLC